VRFHDTARRSDSPTGIAETKEKIIKKQQQQFMHVNKNKLPPGTDPKYSQPKSLPVQQNILPYKKPDGHQTPADKMHTAFNMRQK